LVSFWIDHVQKMAKHFERKAVWYNDRNYLKIYESFQQQ
jgi:hypothetical protein